MAILSRLRLYQFRNYARAEAQFEPGVNLIVGENGQGKTNLLEAIFYLSLLRSFRSGQVRSLRQWERDAFALEAMLGDASSGRHCQTLSVSYGERRSLQIDGAPVTRASEFINQLMCIVMGPEDIHLVKGAAGVRRRFMDIFLTQWAPGYLAHLQRYVQALRSRNAMLRHPTKYGASVLQSYELLLVQHGAALTEARSRFCSFLSKAARNVFTRLSGEDGQLGIQYASSVWRVETTDLAPGETAERMSELLLQSRDRDRREGRTTYGPHRDDLTLLLDDRSLAEFGSQGQCRLASIAIRLGSGELLLSRSGEPADVVYLVDDVTGELDQSRNAAFLADVMRGRQVFLAATHTPEGLPVQPASVHRVASGAFL